MAENERVVSTMGPDGIWRSARPLNEQGLLTRIEFWLYNHRRLPRIAAALGRWDERGLRG